MRHQAHRRERLVDLDDVEVGGGEALAVQRLLDRVGRLLVQRRVGPGHVAVRTDLGQPRQPELLGLRPAHDDDRGTRRR